MGAAHAVSAPNRSVAQGELSAWEPHCPRKDGSPDAGDMSQTRGRWLGSHARWLGSLGHEIVHKYNKWNRLIICEFMQINKKGKRKGMKLENDHLMTTIITGSIRDQHG